MPHFISNFRSEFYIIKNSDKIVQGESSDIFIDDRDGIEYRTVKIENQIWFKKNLQYKMLNGCWAYDGKEGNAISHGYLYDWDTIMNNGKNICPSGWHIPTKEEFETLLDNLGKEKKRYNNIGDRGISGFDALFGGWRSNDGEYHNIEKNAYFWTISEIDATDAWSLNVNKYYEQVSLKESYKKFGYSIRCIKD